MVVVGVLGGDSAFLRVGDGLDGDPGQLLPTVEHVPLLPEVRDHDAGVPKLAGVHDHGLLFLHPDGLIDGDDPAQVIHITEDKDVVFETGLLCDLGVDLVNVDLVVEPVAHLNQVVGPGLPADGVLGVV